MSWKCLRRHLYNTIHAYVSSLRDRGIYSVVRSQKIRLNAPSLLEDIARKVC